MNDPYSVLGIQPGADDETIKKAYRSKCKQYHPDLHPGDTVAEEKFKEVQAAYSEIMKIKQGGYSQSSYGGYAQNGYGQQYRQGYSQNGYGQYYRSPFGFGFGFDPFGGAYSQSSYGAQDEDTRMQAARNYINARHYAEAMNVLNSIPESERQARWYYYAALASSGLGNRVNALEFARRAVEMDPNSYEYRNLLDRLQNYSRSYQDMNSSYHVQTMDMGSWCFRMILLNLFCNLCGVRLFWCC